MHKSSIYLPTELKRELAALAARTGRSEADLTRSAIERLLALSEAPAPTVVASTVTLRRPALIGVGVGPGDPGFVTERARSTLAGADEVVVLSTDVRSVGRAEMVVRAVAPTARVRRVPFAVSGDADARQSSLADIVRDILAAVDAGGLVAVALIGDPSQWTVFPQLAACVAAERPALHIGAEPGITSYQAAAAATGTALGVPGAAMVVLDDARGLRRRLAAADDSVVLYKASTDSDALKAAAAEADRDGAIVAELSGLPGERVHPLADLPDGPVSYLAAVVFPGHRADVAPAAAGADTMLSLPA